ncbi:MAG TPA: N-acetylmuramoyl-L-alanine amidase [Nitrososphaera sp.]|jgi:hypothetical protein
MPLLTSQTPNIGELKISEYKVVVLDVDSGTSQDLSQLVSSIQWDYDLDQPAEHYTITFVHTENIAKKVKPGDRIKLYGWAVRPVGSNIEMYWELLKRVYIVETSLSSDQGGTLKATGYNVMWYIMRNKDTVMLEKETASQFITRTAAYYGIPLGTIMDTGVQLEREPFINRTVWDMWVSALSYTRDLNASARFILQEKDGKIELIARTPSSGIWNFHRGMFEPGPNSWNNNPGNIFSSVNNFSMQNYSNVIRVYKGSSGSSSSNPLEGGGDSSTPMLQFQYPAQAIIEAGGDKEIEKYGMFVESVDLQAPGEAALDLGNDGSNAEQQGMKLYKKLVKFENTGTITTFNINTIRPGDAVHIRDEITGLVGKYYVKSGNHMISDQEASMSLTVNIEDALPEAYEARAQTKSGAGLLGSTGGGQVAAPSGRNWTIMGGSVPIPDRYALAVSAGFNAGEDALKMTTISLYECGNCNMEEVNPSGDVGLWQINSQHWPTYGGPDVLKNPPAAARAAYGIWKGAGGGEAGFRQWCVYPNGCGLTPGTHNQPTVEAFNAKLAEVRAIVMSGGTKADTGWAPVDVRGKLPTNHEANYDKRDLAGITGITLHFTDGPASQTVYQIAQYQTSEDARGQTGNDTPFPGLAYTFFVEQDGKTSQAWDLDVATWHSSAPGRNTHNIGICYSGNVAPNAAQINGMAQAIGYCQKQLGRKIGVEGHKDYSLEATQCPGPTWPSWRQDIMSGIPLTF